MPPLYEMKLEKADSSEILAEHRNTEARNKISYLEILLKVEARNCW
jgi:hypothetical protein